MTCLVRPKPLNQKVQITIFVADHAHCELTRRSVTGIIAFLDSTPIRFISHMQKTVETSTYGSERVATRIATDLAIELRYSIRMLGLDVDGPALVLIDRTTEQY